MCPGSGKPPRSSKDFQLDSGGVWTVGDCAMCGRTYCALTRAGMVWPHKRSDDKPSTGDIIATVRAAQELLTEALRALEKLDV